MHNVVQLFELQSIFLCSLILSFILNVTATRIPIGEPILSPLYCSYCKEKFDIPDLIRSLFLWRKCRYCGLRMSLYNVIVQLLISFILSFVSWNIGFTTELLIALPLVCFLVMISICDFYYRIIPDIINLLFLLYFIVAHVVVCPEDSYEYLLGILAGGGTLFLLAWISKGGMGGGDIKLMAVVGLTIGWKLVLLSLLIASLLGSLIGGILLIFDIIKRKEPIPFGPFLAVGTFTSYFWGDEMIQLYLNVITNY